MAAKIATNARRTLATIFAAIAVTAAHSTAHATSNCKLVRIADWPVRIERNHLLVDGTVNGQKVAILLDTGAPSTLIFRATAERLGLPQRDPKNIRMYGMGGETKVYVAEVKEFRIGDAVRTNWQVYVAGKGDYGADMLLGEEFFRAVDVEFDLAHNAVRLYQPKDCDGIGLAYWASSGIGEVPILDISAARPQIVIPVQINGQPLNALFDSGAASTVLYQAEAARLGVTPDTPGVVRSGKAAGLGDRTLDSWIGSFKSFTIGNETINDVDFFFTDFQKDATYAETGSHLPTKVSGLHSMLLGVDFLLAHRVLVAHSQRKVYFTYNGQTVFQLQRPSAGGP